MTLLALMMAAMAAAIAAGLAVSRDLDPGARASGAVFFALLAALMAWAVLA